MWSMAKFQIVEIPDAPPSSRWTIEEVTPGEKPNPLAVFGSRASIEAEVHRLNRAGRFPAKGHDPVS
jgi:hypothetical protein